MDVFDRGLELYAKLEFCNGVGSIKDRPAFWILKRAIERGEIHSGTTVIESSSGNFACALAVFCKILRLNFIPVIDPNVSPLYEQMLRCNCETVVKVTERDDTGGFLKTRLAKVEQLLTDYPDSYWTNQYENRDAAAAHYELTGREAAELEPDYVFLGVGTGGTIAGVSRRLKQANPAVRVIAVDAEGSMVFGGPPKRRCLPGLGSSIRPPLVQEAEIDEIMIVSEVDTVAACHQLLNRHRLFVGASTGSVYSAIGRYFAGRRNIAALRVLFLCCDRGSAYVHNVFDPEWAAWRERISVEEEELTDG